MDDLTPRAIVNELDKYVVGQAEAKRAVAVALRNRARRRQLPEDMRGEVAPKNILLIGPTGVGKTEIARRVALLAHAPFIKVEATRFTEAGYVGRDAESIVHELVEKAVSDQQQERLREVEQEAEGLALRRLAQYLYEQKAQRRRRQRRRRVQELHGADSELSADEASMSPRTTVRRLEQEQLARQLQERQLEDEIVEIDVTYDEVYDYDPCPYARGEEPREAAAEARKRRRVRVREARRILVREEASRLVDFDEVVEHAVRRAEDDGVVFIDELDKIAGPRIETGADVSGVGVQRDLLPIVEGCTVMTRYGPVHTSHVLYIGAGSFQHNRPSELIPELQGRFPLRVELRPLTEGDLVRILTEPQNALTKQYQALLATEGVELQFTDDAVEEIARLACLMNSRTENIGARRLHTIMERVLEDVAFNAPERHSETVTVDTQFVGARMGELIQDQDLSRYIV